MQKRWKILPVNEISIVKLQTSNIRQALEELVLYTTDRNY